MGTSIQAGRDINVTGDIIHGDKTIGYTAEQVSVLLTQIRTTFQPKPFDGRCPYRGLEAFGEDDAEYFFGRERLVTELVERVKHARCVVIAGPSGSGKSSLVRAGLIPALKRGGLPHSDRWRYEMLTPGRSPLDELARVATSLGQTTNAGNEIRSKGMTDVAVLHQWAEAGLGDERDRRALIVVDQFEETFTQVAREDERAAFLNLLTHAATVETGRVTVVFILRSDFISNCATYPELNALLNQQFFQVGAMPPDELVSAIARPALQVGLRIDPDLIAQIINDMQDEPGALPLMQFALKDLFDAQQAAGGVIALTLEGYLARGGLHKALERHADAAFAQLNPAEQVLARDIFTKLIQPGRGTQDTRRTVAFEELVPAGADPIPVETVVRRLAEPHLRLITTDERNEQGLRVRIATIAHEKLIDAWPWLKRLVNENREAIALQNEIADDAQAWEQNRRDKSYLYRGARLATAREKLAAKHLALSELTQTFVATSLDREESVQRTRNRIIAGVGALLFTAAIISVLFGLQSNANARQAQAEAQGRATQQAIAEANLARAESLRLAVEANIILQSSSGNAETAALLSIRSLQSGYSSQADAALVKASSRLYTRKQFTGHTGGVMSVAFSPDGESVLTGSGDRTARLWDAASGGELRTFTGHAEGVSSVAFSPDGKYVLTGSYDSTARLWDAASGDELRTFTGHTGAVFSVAFSPDGKYVLTGSYDNTAQLWDAISGEELRPFTGHTGAVSSVAFSPDGKYVLTGSYDNTARLWDAVSGDELRTFTGYTGYVMSVAFSPNGKYVLTGSYDNTARLWDAVSGDELRTFTGYTGYVMSVAFSPDGKYVLTGSYDSTARLWDAASGDELRVFTGHTNGVTSVTFSPDGKYVLTGTYDNTARLWDVMTGQELRTFTGHTGAVFSVAFSPDGKYVLTGSYDSTARLWDAASGDELRVFTGHTNGVTSVAFSPDGKYVLTGSYDNTARLWDAASGDELHVFTGHTGAVSSVAFSPDGKSVLTGSGDSPARLWDAASGRQLRVFTGYTGGMRSVAFSPDGKSILTGGGDSPARLWDAVSGGEIRAFTGNTGTVSSVAFSPDGKSMLIGGGDSTARLWDAATGTVMRVFTGHTSFVLSVAFSPDSQSVLTGSWDRAARLWDAASGRQLRVFTGHTEGVSSVAFSPDGKFVLTGSYDNTARLWDTDYHGFIRWVCSRLLRDLTDAERAQYGITDGRATCE